LAVSSRRDTVRVGFSGCCSGWMWAERGREHSLDYSLLLPLLRACASARDRDIETHTSTHKQHAPEERDTKISRGYSYIEIPPAHTHAREREFVDSRSILLVVATTAATAISLS